MPTPTQTRLGRAALAGLLAGGALWGAMLPGRTAAVQTHAETLSAIASEAAARLDASRQEQVRGPGDAGSDAFLREREVLRAVQHAHDLGTPLYTLRDLGGDRTAFVVMTNAAPFIGDTYGMRPEMRAVFSGAARAAHTDLYGDDHGDWISGYAGISGPDGRVVAVVSADRPSGDLAAARARAALLAALVGLLTGAAAALFPLRALLALGPVQVARRALTSSLSIRIGLAGSGAVLVAVGVISALDHCAARAELVDHRKAELSAVVRLGALQVSPDLHEAVARSGDADAIEFSILQAQLRQIQHAAGLTSPVYTLRRDGDLARFVGMTNETPFVGDAFALRPGVAATFEGGGVGTDGPYTDAHGTWISAWSPLTDASGAVVGVLQADHDVAAGMAQLWNRALLRGLFALVGVAVAFLAAALLARSIARPVRQVADAARQVGEGNYDITVPDDRLDEVGDLARALRRAAEGLSERERLRDMFGKYMATQVVQDLLDQGEVSLAGELREVTVLITDIRGYTALTEQLGATEVVALLNSYFSVLVDVVLSHDGVIDKFMGDALLCWFGAPVPQADHAARAVAAAHDMMERTATWNQVRVAAGLPPVATGIGIAHGRVVVGNIGSPQRLEYTAIGDAVNLASRLCGKADAGEVLITAGVQQAAGGDFEVVGDLEVKGVRAPVAVLRRRYPIVAA